QCSSFCSILLPFLFRAQRLVRPLQELSEAQDGALVERNRADAHGETVRLSRSRVVGGQARLEPRSEYLVKIGPCIHCKDSQLISPEPRDDIHADDPPREDDQVGIKGLAPIFDSRKDQPCVTRYKLVDLK